MPPESVISIISVLVTAGVAIFGLLLSERRHQKELAREIERTKKHREDMPLFQFDMEIGTVYKKGDEYLVEIKVILDNRGNVKQDIKSIKLRVRTINKEDNLSFWKDREYRVEFPNKVFETEIIPKGYKFIFVEPNVKQLVNYTTMLNTNVEIVSAKAEFSYGRARNGSRGSKHSVEKIFAINC